MSNLTTVAYLILQADSCLRVAIDELGTHQAELAMAESLSKACSELAEVWRTLYEHVCWTEGVVEAEFRPLNTINRKSKVDTKSIKKIKKCAKTTKRKVKK